ncbi:MAG: YggS family pyridoxal phosphate-dependent enzyme [Candidatus Margulisbacteria bacterium]|nr:YggS family pyridoxal phosphate-dependent enzyme [Candidatus Margulisiibacteriota bacterium]
MNFSEKIKKTRQLIEETKTVDSVRLIGVTKYLDLQGTEDAILSGLTNIGENRLQVAEAKILDLKPKYPNVSWHFIGRLQSNKAKKIITLFDYIHSIDSSEKLQLIDNLCLQENKSIKILIQLDISGEKTKQGMDEKELFASLDQIKSLQKARFVGLMTMAPLTKDETILRNVFKKTKGIGEELRKKGIICQELSMGMSNDYIIALQEGATMLRLGTVLFLKEETNE